MLWMACKQVEVEGVGWVRVRDSRACHRSAALVHRRFPPPMMQPSIGAAKLSKPTFWPSFPLSSVTPVFAAPHLLLQRGNTQLLASE